MWIARFRTAILALSPLFAWISAAHCHAQQYTRQGAVVGGVTGAVIGGLMGKQSNKTTGGALIGGAVGAVAGGVLGNGQDKQIARRDYEYQQALYAQQRQIYAQQHVISQQPIYQQPAEVGVSTTDVLSMCRSGVTEAVIVSQIHSRGVQRRLEVNDIISLHQQGVSEAIITAMQAAPVSSPTMVRQTYSQPVIVNQTPVIVREQPVYYGGGPVVIEHRSYPVHQYHRHRF